MIANELAGFKDELEQREQDLNSKELDYARRYKQLETEMEDLTAKLYTPTRRKEQHRSLRMKYLCYSFVIGQASPFGLFCINNPTLPL